MQLPFGLVLKWSDRTSKEEVAAMQMARAAGMPVPKVLSCGEHPNAPYNRFWSILTTRLPGIQLENSYDTLHVESEEPCCLNSKPASPPCVNGPRLMINVYALSLTRLYGVPDPVSGHGFDTTEKYLKARAQTNNIRNFQHRITFTHGDFKAHNILVGDDGHLSGFLDWESAGWLPEYWDYTTAMRFGVKTWWFQVASWMGGDEYAQELF
ncbi:hypothetical protein N7528_004116 [Penicillium herquei]|nr:hypothetical protein N7528_004116 [Penicillium herquei]